MLCSQCAVDGIVPVGTQRVAVAIPCQFRYEIASSRRGIMTIRLISAATLIAGMLTAPALAQLPRPSGPPPAAQKGMAPGPGAQKGAPQQQAQPPVAPPAPYTALKVGP